MDVLNVNTMTWRPGTLYLKGKHSGHGISKRRQTVPGTPLPVDLVRAGVMPQPDSYSFLLVGGLSG